MNKYADDYQQNLYKKFPSTHYLSNPNNIHNVLLWSTFFRRNLHRLATDYLGIRLHIYQQLILYMMGISQLVVIVACRAAAKSFIIALYACCKAISKPNSKIVLGSATRGQSKLIISEKIKNELMNMSPMLAREIKTIKDSANESVVTFHNGSTIKVFTANEFARGLRSTDAVREEFRQIDKNIDDSVISPFQTIRQAPYLKLPQYESISELQEDPVDIYISSSWFDNGHWMWDIVDQAKTDMLNGESSIMLAFDESITLKHNIRTMKQMKQERKKQDPITWSIEFLNLRIKDSASAYFTYAMLTASQKLRQVFYPRRHEEYKHGKRGKTFLPKQEDEIRVISCDIAFVEGETNDNSVYSCIRAIQESITHYTESSELVVKQGYKRQYPYLESNQIGDTHKQAIRIRQLYEDFDADYIVLDTRNGGTQVLYSLGKLLYDEERGVEYPPLKCMNNDTYASVVKNPNAKEVIFAINATQSLNSEIAQNFRRNLVEEKIELLISPSLAKEEILSQNKDYTNEINLDIQLAYEKPFYETQILIGESAELMYEKNPQTGAIKVYEQSGNRKDRYTSASYGSYFIDQLELDLISDVSNYDFTPLYN